MRNALYIENLPAHLGRAELERLLRPYGLMRDVLLVADPDMFRRHAGLAVATMATPVQARAAMRALDGVEYHGCNLRVRLARAADAARLAWMCQEECPTHRKPGVRCTHD